MPGLNNFRNGAAPAPVPTTYTGSYATTAQDARDKCQGNVVASVTRTSTSTVSLVEAIKTARQNAINAIVCPVFSDTYTTTPQDFEAKCGAGKTGEAVTRSSTSGLSKAQALAQATQDAINAIVCPLPIVYVGAFFSPQPTEAEIVAVQRESWTRGARVLRILCSDQYPGWCEPKTQGIRTSFQNESDSDITTSITRYNAVINGEEHWLYTVNVAQYDSEPIVIKISAAV